VQAAYTTPPRIERRSRTEHSRMMQFSQGRRALMWIILAILIALLCLAGFRAYLGSGMLLNFSNLFSC
jgi:hypothetical protein